MLLNLENVVVSVGWKRVDAEGPAWNAKDQGTV